MPCCHISQRRAHDPRTSYLRPDKGKRVRRLLYPPRRSTRLRGSFLVRPYRRRNRFHRRRRARALSPLRHLFQSCTPRLARPKQLGMNNRQGARNKSKIASAWLSPPTLSLVVWGTLVQFWTFRVSASWPAKMARWYTCLTITCNARGTRRIHAVLSGILPAISLLHFGNFVVSGADQGCSLAWRKFGPLLTVHTAPLNAGWGRLI